MKHCAVCDISITEDDPYYLTMLDCPDVAAGPKILCEMHINDCPDWPQ